MRRLGRPAQVVVVTLVVVAALFVFVFPTQAFLAQRREVADVDADLRTLREQNDVLAEEIVRLTDPAKIEELARERFNLVRPGEQAFAVIPGPSESSPVPPPVPTPSAEDSEFRLSD